MIIIRVMGGLGNQLYQYALYLLFLQRGKEVKLDILSYGEENEIKDKRPLDLLLFSGLNFEFCNKKERYKYLDQSEHFIHKIRRKFIYSYDHVTYEKKQYMPEILNMESGYLQGYWNSERYSSNVENIIKETLQFPEVIGQKNREIAQEISGQNSVSIHIRRGDYLLPENQKIFGEICTEEYYKSAINKIKQTIDNPQLYIFCDDAEYVRGQFQDTNCQIVDWNVGKDSIFDMYLMSLCRGNICANSTFSVWAAKLNKRKDQVKIRPEILDNEVKQDYDEVLTLQKNNWILINKNGRIL